MSDRQWYVLARLAGVTVIALTAIVATVVVARIGEGAALAVALIVLSGVVQWVSVSDQRILLHFRHGSGARARTVGAGRSATEAPVRRWRVTT